ncbi:hypothetical protein N0V83_006780 [Neocucurbitaria cava]|uniref:MARVEL domain-containing protein n=1 Tax=Neocucurbitaria cava TaxID=798079 RepID=A0A9W8Y6L6_9PLEO|nr:hypothetical protein N0V83_006780 [Neocucurbitaria cava]
MVAPALVLGLRGVQVVFSIIVLGLTAYLVNAFTTPWASWSPHSLNFMLFTSVWTLLAVAYLVLSPTRFPRAAHNAFLWLTFLATTVLAALHIRRTPRGDTAPPPDMAGV